MSKVVLITGASSGIGKSIAAYLSGKGMLVYGTSRTKKEESLLPYKMIALNVLDIESIQKAVATIIEKRR